MISTIYHHKWQKVAHYNATTAKSIQECEKLLSPVYEENRFPIIPPTHS